MNTFSQSNVAFVLICPSCRAASAVTTLNVEPGGSSLMIARLFIGYWFLGSLSSFHFFSLMPPTKSLRSNVG